MNVLQFGYGNFGKFHCQAWLELGHRVTVVDPAKPGLSHIRHMGELGYWTKMETQDSVVKAEPSKHWGRYTDVVDIVTPIDSHLTQVHMAYDASIPFIFCEKPLCKKTFTACNIPRCYIGYGYRFVPGMQELMNSTDPFFLSWYGNKHPEWSYADLMWNDGVHIFDLFKHLIGRYPAPDEYYLSNQEEGMCEDPVVRGAFTSKSIRNRIHIVTFSTIDPVYLLKEQFIRMIDRHGEGLHTLQDSVELHQAIENTIKEME